jgi:predicted secreted hydrolase
MALVAALFVVTGGAMASTRGWRPADPAYRVELPRDHAAHPETKIEWWYYTGNVATADGRRFGYHLTFFRVGVDMSPSNPSRWAVRDLHMAHFAVSDLERGEHVYADRLNRAATGWAGARADTFRVWNEDWDVTRDERGRHLLRARDARFAIELVLDEGKPVVLHGDRGYSRKGPTPGNASHYYSLTRMPTHGSLTLDGRRFDVTGTSWMDHEWGTSFLEPGQEGWDWFSIQFDDGSEMMLFQIRASKAEVGSAGDGSTALGARSGTLVDAAGRVTALGPDDFALSPGRKWTSPRSGATYPVEWRLDVPGQSLQVVARAVFSSQELRTEQSTAVTYWEGVIDVKATRAGRPVTGRGYLEMTGYTGRPMSDVLR